MRTSVRDLDDERADRALLIGHGVVVVVGIAEVAERSFLSFSPRSRGPRRLKNLIFDFHAKTALKTVVYRAGSGVEKSPELW